MRTITLHQFRHSHATMLLTEGIIINEVFESVRVFVRLLRTGKTGKAKVQPLLPEAGTFLYAQGIGLAVGDIGGDPWLPYCLVVLFRKACRPEVETDDSQMILFHIFTCFLRFTVYRSRLGSEAHYGRRGSPRRIFQTLQSFPR